MKQFRIIKIKLLTLLLIFCNLIYADPLELSFDFSNYVLGTQPDQMINSTGTSFDGVQSGMLFQDIVIGSDLALMLYYLVPPPMSVIMTEMAP